VPERVSDSRPLCASTGATRQRRVTSFVHQRNRLTEGQAHAWDRLWPTYGLDVADVVSGVVPYDPPAWFGRRAPLVLEIGSGTGESTAAQAAAVPEADHLAVERRVRDRDAHAVSASADPASRGTTSASAR